MNGNGVSMPVEVLEPSKQTEIAVVIPYSPEYTPEVMLKEAIQSVQDQTVPATVYVVTDRKQQGPAAARNTGLKVASERFVAFLDADDLWSETKLKRQRETMADTGAGMSVEGPNMSTDEFLRRLLTSDIRGLTPSILVDTSQTSVKFDESLERREDHLYILEVASEAGVCFDRNLVTVRKHEAGLSVELETNEETERNFWETATERVPDISSYEDLYWAQSHIEIALTHLQTMRLRTGLGHLLASLRIRPRPKPVLFLLVSPAIVLYYALNLNEWRKRR